MNFNPSPESVLSLFSAFFGALFGWIAGLRRNKKEIDKLHLENIESVINLYKTMLDDLANRYNAEMDSLRERCKEYENHIEKLEKRVNLLTEKIKEHGIQL